jgi:D-glycero-alpha-D-manno-heptose 1-phosphate guanylyltransferase
VNISSEKISAVILAGGFGTRIKHLLGDLPKPMAQINGKPFLEWIVRWLAAQNISNVILSTGYQAEMIEKYFQPQPIKNVSVKYVREIQPLGTGGGVLHAIRASQKKPSAWLVLNGDTLFFANLKTAIKNLGDVDGVVFGREVPDASRYGTLKFNAQNILERFEEKRPGKGIISTGVYLFRPQLIEKFPNKIPVSLETEIFPALISGGAQLKVCVVNAPFLDIGTPESLAQAEQFIRENLKEFVL